MRHLSLAALLVSLACNRAADPGTPPPAPGDVAITPGAVSLLVGARARFAATIVGAPDGGVSWSVVEGADGGVVAADGAYLAPSRPGRFRVRATSVVDPARFADADVTVRPYAETIARMPDGFDARDRHTATLLEDGTVLVVGGRGYTGTGTLARADRFDPVTSTFRDGGNLTTPRHDHAALRLADGKVLVAGGWDQSTAGTGLDPVLRTTERYDPVASTFTTGPEMVFPRRHHTMTLLDDGRVFVAGGIQLRGTGFGASPNTETYDPAADAFTEGPRMVASFGRWLHSATRLADGRVLLAGGRDNNCRDACPLYALASAEIYDPATGTFAPTGSLNVSRYGHSAALLPDGRVLVLGGATFEDLGTGGDAVTAAEVWDPATGAFSRAGATGEGRAFHALASLNDGRFLLVGGQNANGSPIPTTELFDPATGRSTPGPETGDWRVRATATTLHDGEVLVVGGNNSGGPVRPVDRFR